MAITDFLKISNEPSENENRLPSYADQNFLVDFLSEFDRLKGSAITQNYKNFIMMDPKWESSLFLNDLTKIDKGQSLLENIPRSLLGDLQPYFRLYLTEGMKKGQYKEVKLPLNNARDKDGRPFDDITRDRKGLRVGFRSFSWDYLGSHPGDIDYHINCALKLYFESPQALFHEYTTAKNETYGFYNLIYRRGPADKGSKFDPKNSFSSPGKKHTHETSLDYHQKDFRIKIEIGYIPPKLERTIDSFIEQGLSGGGAIQAAKDFIAALRANKIELYLTLVKHTFEPTFSSTDFGFEMKIEFVGSVEQAFVSDDANILIRKNPQHEKNLKELEKKAQELKTLAIAKGHFTRRALEAIEEVDLDIIKAEIAASPKGDPDDTNQVKNQISTSLNDILSANEVQPANADINPDQIDTAYDYLKATSDKSNYEDKLLLSPANKYDLYRRIMCNLNDNGRVYNLKIPDDDFTDYINKRGKLKEGAGLTPAQIAIYKEKSKNVDKYEKARLKKEIKDALRGIKTRKATLSFFRKKFFNNKSSKYSSGGDGVDNKIRKSIMRSFQANFGVGRTDIDVTEYAKYIDNSMNKKDAQSGKEDKTHYLHWFYYGDLLDSVIETIRENKELELDIWNKQNTSGLLKIILGNVEYIDHITGKNTFINIADVPISLGLWEEFWHKFVVSDFKEVYYFKTFLKDSFTYLVKSSLVNRSRLPGDAVIRMTPGIDYMDVSTKEFNSKFSITQNLINKGNSYFISRKKDFVDSSKKTDIDNILTGEDTQRILYMFDMSNKPGYLIGGDKTQDNSYGVYHLIPGQYNTPIQQISFTKTDQPLWLEAKAYNNDYLRKNVHYSEPYNCNFTIFGNTLIRPGRHIYIRFPYAWFGSPSLEGTESRALGLGGYFLMTKTSNTVVLSPGGGRLEWNTTAQALWTTYGGIKKKPMPNVKKEPYSIEDFARDPDDAYEAGARSGAVLISKGSPHEKIYEDDLDPRQREIRDSLYGRDDTILKFSPPGPED